MSLRVSARLRSVFVLVMVFAALVLVAWLRYTPPQQTYPEGSSLSSAPDGTRALFLWLEAAGARPRRLERAPSTPQTPPAPPDVVFLVQPLFPIQPQDASLYDAVADRGGTLVLAGTSPALVVYARQLGFRFRTAGSPGAKIPFGHTPDGLSVPYGGASYVESMPAPATPLLTAPGGEWLAAHKPYRNGDVILLASAQPLTNDGLRDAAAARFVYRLVLVPLPPRTTVAFDEAHYQLGGATRAAPGQQARVLGWLLGTRIGGAAVYAGALLLVYLLLPGRRLGPALAPVRAGQARRTMYEQVQALAGLYRRSHQLGYLRAHYAHHYRRRLARALGMEASAGPASSTLAEELAQRGLPRARAAAVAAALAGFDRARDERQLLSAVAEAEQAFADLPRSRYATLSAEQPT